MCGWLWWFQEDQEADQAYQEACQEANQEEEDVRPDFLEPRPVAVLWRPETKGAVEEESSSEDEWDYL